MNTNYKIITTWGRYQTSKEARLYERSKIIIFGCTIYRFWKEIKFIRASQANERFVRRKVNEWSDEYRVPTSNIVDKTT